MDEDNVSPFVPYELPPVKIKDGGNSEGAKALYHTAMYIWHGIKRTRANDQMRKHGTWLEHEAEVTKFRDELD